MRCRGCVDKLSEIAVLGHENSLLTCGDVDDGRILGPGSDIGHCENIVAGLA